MAKRPWLVPGAFILLGLIWGSSFLRIKIGVVVVSLRYDQVVSLVTRRGSRR
jgi:hypothetical protein